MRLRLNWVAYLSVAVFVGVCSSQSSQTTTKSIDWSPIDDVLEAQIAAKCFPGCTALIGDDTGTLYAKGYGHVFYQPNSFTVDTFTKFDLASLTKVLATTSAIMTFYQRGELALEERISSDYLLGPEYAQQGKGTIEVLNCLLHNSGYPPDPIPGYSDPSFGCPETSLFYPQEVFSCQDQIYASLLNQTLINPVGAVYVYSDLSMITLMYVVGRLASQLGYISQHQLLPGCDQGGPGAYQCYYEAYVRLYVLKNFNMWDSGFLPSQSQWKYIMPTWNDSTYRHLYPIQGQVSDANAYALGGISGHAGLFSQVWDIQKLLHHLMFESDNFINSTTVKLFTTIWNVTQSSRALGWDTNNYLMQTYRGCGNLSQTTFTHTGYTGTQVCCDPLRKIYAILLTDRVYPNATGNVPCILAAREAFSNTVRELWDNAHPSSPTTTT